MKYQIHISGVIDTDDYADVKTTRQVHSLVKAMLRREADLPENVKFSVHPIRFQRVGHLPPRASK